MRKDPSGPASLEESDSGIGKSLVIGITPKTNFQGGQLIKWLSKEDVYESEWKPIIEGSLSYDVICLGEEFLEESVTNYSDLLLDLNCSVYLYPSREVHVDHILFLFDGTPSSMTVMKKAIAFFGPLGNQSITLLTLNKPREKQFYREHLIVNFLLSKFNDVGVLAIQKELLASQVKRILHIHPNTLMVSGVYGAQLILKSELKQLLQVEKVPFYFSH